MCLDLFSEETPCGSILVSDHSVFVFWLVAYGRFDFSIVNKIAEEHPTTTTKNNPHKCCALQ